MLVKIILFLMLLNTFAFASIGVTITQQQLNTLCVKVKLSIDNDYHWFYYKTILAFDQDGMTIAQSGGKTMFFPRNELQNFDEAFNKWDLLEKIKP